MIVPDHNIHSSDGDTSFVGIFSAIISLLGTGYILKSKEAGASDILILILTAVILPNVCIVVKDYYIAHWKERVIRPRKKIKYHKKK